MFKTWLEVGGLGLALGVGLEVGYRSVGAARDVVAWLLELVLQVI